MKKHGFSLAEMLVVTDIVALLIGTGVQSFKVNDKSIKYLYSNTYYALSTALYNAMNIWIPEDYFRRAIFENSVVNDDNETVPIARDSSSDEGAKRLCRALIQYINPIQNIETTCHKDNLVDITADKTEFINKPVQFTATNGVRFWITKRYPANAGNDDLTFYLIFADLNGTKLPNSLEYRPGTNANGWKTKDPDIFAFAAMSNGFICPVGVAEVEPRYLTARIMYDDRVNGEDILRYSTTSRSLIGAKAEAWGYYTRKRYNSNNQNSGTTDIHYTEVDPNDINAMEDNKFIQEEKGLSYGDWLKQQIEAQTAGAPNESIAKTIYAFLNGQTFQQYFNNDILVKDIIMRNDSPRHNGNDIRNIGGYGCFPHNITPCEVIVDRYVY